MLPSVGNPRASISVVQTRTRHHKLLVRTLEKDPTIAHQHPYAFFDPLAMADTECNGKERIYPLHMVARLNAGQTPRLNARQNVAAIDFSRLVTDVVAAAAQCQVDRPPPLAKLLRLSAPLMMGTIHLLNESGE